MRIARNMIELIGHTPLMEVSAFSRKHGLHTPLVVKPELFNPSGSVKARAALAMITDAEQRGILKPGGTIIEPTSGNTGIGLAMIAAIRGYRLILTMPETMSMERRKLLKAMGAELVLTPSAEGMAGSIDKAKKLKANIEGSFIPQQFDNPANPKIHEMTTAEEIWKDTDGQVDVFVAGVGTGGTLSGVARTLKKYNPNIYIVGIEPLTSPILKGGQAGPHKIQGIGANFIPQNYDASVVDEIIDISNENAILSAQDLAMTEGLLVGISSGAALYGAIQIAQRSAFQGKRIIVLLPDTGERYLSTELFD